MPYADPTSERARAAFARRERKYRMKKQYGITVEQYDEMHETQGGACKICREVCRTGRRLAVDHNHETGEVRGLLCYNCNSIVACEDPEMLERAAKYLRGEL